MDLSVLLQTWLAESPKYTVFRINKLTEFDDTNIKNVLKIQSKEFNIEQIPKFYSIKPDCLVVEQWSPEVTVERSNKEVVVNSMCAAAVLRGAHVFAPAVLGLPTNCKLNESVDVFADLDGQCKRGLKIEYTGRKKYVGTGYLKMLRRDLFDNGVQPKVLIHELEAWRTCGMHITLNSNVINVSSTGGIAIEMLLPHSRLPVINESINPKGQLVLQNLPSIVTGWVLDAKAYEYILDMCAAPGNKTTHSAEMSNNCAYITAIDKTDKKVTKIKQSCQTQGVTCVNAYVYDSTKCHLDNANNEKSPPFKSNTFDKVLLDAPCSGLGQRPQLSFKMSPKTLQSFKFMQRKLFDSAIKVLKVGGKLVYSTCTVTVEENEGMVSWVLDKFPCMKLIPAEPFYGGPGLPNVGLNDEQRSMVQRFGPEEDQLRLVEDLYKNTIGFFIAAFTKTNDH